MRSTALALVVTGVMAVAAGGPGRASAGAEGALPRSTRLTLERVERLQRWFASGRAAVLRYRVEGEGASEPVEVALGGAGLVVLVPPGAAPGRRAQRLLFVAQRLGGRAWRAEDLATGEAALLGASLEALGDWARAARLVYEALRYVLEAPEGALVQLEAEPAAGAAAPGAA